MDSVVRLSLGPGLGIHPARRDLARGPLLRPPPVGSLPEALVHWAQLTPTATAFYLLDIDQQLTTLTYAGLLRAARRVAAGLRERGVRRGDPVILCLDTGPDYLAAFFGCGLLGAVPAPLYPPGDAGLVGQWQQNLERVMRRVGCRVVVVERRLLAPTLAVADRFVGGLAVDAGAPGEPDEALLPPPLAPDELAFIQHTSGTTSSPKGVMVTHAALLANLRVMMETSGWNAGGSLGICWLPLFHDMGLVGCVLGPVWVGGPAVLMPPLLFLFGPRRWLWAYHHFRGTHGPAPNFAYALCVDRVSDEELEGLDLSSWRVAFNGAEQVQPRTIRRFTERFGRHGFSPGAMYPVYGMAETTLAATFPTPGTPPRIEAVKRTALQRDGRAEQAAPGDPDGVELVGLGRPFPGHELAILGQDGARLPERHQGEIALRGPSLFCGYINDEAATAEALRDGWFHTGDLGFVVDGDLFVSGRIKDLIIKSGRNLHPDDIELAALAVEGVRAGNVAAFGVLDQDSGTEDLIVALESRLPALRDHERMRREVEHAIFTRSGVRPRKILVFPPQTLPKTSSGKLSRARVRQLYLEGALRPGARRGRAAPGAAVDLGLAYLRAAAARLRGVPLVGALVDRLLPRQPLG